jgi:phosphatidylglycerophosphate synthase
MYILSGDPFPFWLVLLGIITLYLFFVYIAWHIEHEKTAKQMTKKQKKEVAKTAVRAFVISFLIIGIISLWVYFNAEIHFSTLNYLSVIINSWIIIYAIIYVILVGIDYIKKRKK